MYILGIETTCDETSVAILKDGKELLVNLIATQVDLHKIYGGVVPEIASRAHLEVLNPLIEQALGISDLSFSDLNAVAVTYGPGLSGAILIGVGAAKTLSAVLDIPLIGVNHLEGHIYANFLENTPDFPAIILIASGGHSSIIYMPEHLKYEILGKTRDDAAGEAFDKVAKALGLSYPGGPIIDDLAKGGNPEKIVFPRAYLEEGSYDFSFSGLKTAVINFIRKNQGNFFLEDLCASFQESVVSVLIDKTFKAAMEFKTKRILVSGGVASNSVLRDKLIKKGKELNYKVYIPKTLFCTDNAAMIAMNAFYRYQRKLFSNLELDALPDLKLQ